MSEVVEVRINNRFDIFLPKHRAERPEWFTAEGWEGKRLDSLHFDIVSADKKPVVFYVGAEEGDMTALCQMWGADVVLFEPNEKVWPNIKLIWEANKLQLPKGSYAGFASSKDSSNSHEGLFDSKFPDSADGEVISDHGFQELISAGDTPQTKIDTMCAALGIIPTIISIDVEGSEWQVLRGAEQTLKEYHPKIYLSLHPEFMYDKYREYSRDLRDWLIALGYTEKILDYQHEVHLVYKKDKNTTSKEISNNIL